MKTLKEVESDYIEEVLTFAKGNRSLAAKILDISLRKVRYFANKSNKFPSERAELSQRDEIFMKKVSSKERDDFENIDSY